MFRIGISRPRKGFRKKARAGLLEIFTKYRFSAHIDVTRHGMQELRYPDLVGEIASAAALSNMVGQMGAEPDGAREETRSGYSTCTWLVSTEI